MSLFDYIFALVLTINYGTLLLNLFNGGYKNRLKVFIIDVLVAYYLAPLIAIAIVWDYFENRKTKIN